MWIRPKNFDLNRDRVSTISPDKLISMRSKPLKYIYATNILNTFNKAQQYYKGNLFQPEYKDNKFYRAKIKLSSKQYTSFKEKYSTQEHGNKQYINNLAKAIESKKEKVPMLILYESEVKSGKAFQGRHRALASKKLNKRVPIIIRRK